MTSILLPCWNALELTKICLRQVLRWTTLPYELILVDNGSSDGTAEWLSTLERRLKRRRLQALEGLRIIRNKVNRGYPVAMNQALALARGKHVVFGNCDAAVTPLWLEGMLEAMCGAPRVGGVSPCSNPWRGRASKAAWASAPWYRDIKGLERFSQASRLLPSSAFVRADSFVPGFWFMAPRALVTRLGGLDERFSPGGFEDFDLQLRLRDAGYSLGFADRVYIHHVWFGCSRLNGLIPRQLYGLEHRRRLDEKHPAAAAMTMDVRTHFERMQPEVTS
jgi:GT2 family glycosyltransferase